MTTTLVTTLSEEETTPSQRRLAERYRRLIQNNHLASPTRILGEYVLSREPGIERVQRIQKNQWLRFWVMVPRLITIKDPEPGERLSYAHVIDDEAGWVDLAVEYVRQLLPEEVAEIVGREYGHWAHGFDLTTHRGILLLVRLNESAAAAWVDNLKPQSAA